MGQALPGDGPGSARRWARLCQAMGQALPGDGNKKKRKLLQSINRLRKNW